jgi:sodium-dependent dicarboxylate transporter 2/3/5
VSAPREGEFEGPYRPGAVAAVAAAGALLAAVPVPGLEWPAHGALAVLAVAAGLWITEAIPLAVTALLIPVLAVALRIAEPKVAFSGFGDPILFLFLGTFLITDATFRHGLNHRLAHSVLHAPLVQRDPKRLVWAVAILGCGISAWVNNTATTAIILPLALAAEGRVPARLLTGVLLMAAYAPSLGGLATPVGTAPNLIGLRLLEEGAGEHVTFARWCAMFAPLAIVATLLTAAWFRFLGRGGAPAPAERAPASHGGTPSHEGPRPWSLAERTLIPVILCVITLWIVPGILLATPLREQAWLKAWNASLPETSVPLLGGAVLFLLPSGRGKSRILDVGVLRRLDWSTLMLFGGGLSLGALMFQTGLARAIGEWIFAVVPIRGEYGIILAATLMAVLVSETTSNTASASLVVPVVLALAQTAGVDPMKPALAATVGCSFGFMLPVSTPPNALVFATGRVRIIEMVRYGVLLDLAGILLVSLWVWWVV